MFPFIAAVAQAGGIIVDKVILTRRRIDLKIFIPVLFLFLFLTTALLFPSFGQINLDIFKPYYLIIFIAMLAAAVGWNFLYYRGVQAEKVQDFELIMMTQPVLTILLASVFLKGERNIHLIIVALIASIALVISHVRREKLEISRASWGLILTVVLMSIELILIDILLQVFSPVALYFVRTGILFVFFIFYYRPHLRLVADHNLLWILLTASLGTIQMISKFYGFQNFGVIYTSLILILAPILVYIISTFLLHERLRTRTIVSVLVILGCIVYATFLGK